MQKIKSKLESSSGETIAEVLVASLIAALAMLLLATMVMSTIHIVTKSEKTMNTFYADISSLEEQETSNETVKITIDRDSTLSGENAGDSTISNVKVYKDTSGNLKSYALAAP